jgi:hypothetical protein
MGRETGMNGRQFVAMAVLIAAAGGARIWAQAGSCPDTFDADDIGDGKTWRFAAFDKSTFGAASVTSSHLILTGRGADIYGAKNEFVTAYRSDLTGDFDVSVKVISLDSTFDWAQAGIVAATDLNDLTKGGYVAVDVSSGHGYTVFYDKTAPAGQLDGNSGAGKTIFPAWLRLAKRGTQYTAYYKIQETGSWTALPTPPPSLNTQANAQIGLFMVSHNANQTGKAVFDDFTCAAPVVPTRARGKGAFAPGFTVFPPAAGTDALGKARRGSEMPAGPLMIFPR